MNAVMMLIVKGGLEFVVVVQDSEENLQIVFAKMLMNVRRISMIATVLVGVSTIMEGINVSVLLDIEKLYQGIAKTSMNAKKVMELSVIKTLNVGTFLELTFVSVILDTLEMDTLVSVSRRDIAIRKNG